MFNNTDRKAIIDLAKKNDLEPAFVLGLFEVESAGKAFWTVNHQRTPPINLEGHYFYRILKEDQGQDKADEAVRLGLAHPTAGKTAIPTSYKGRYDLLHKWADFGGVDAAYRSISMGAGQVMGDWYNELGFPDVGAMWVANGTLIGQVKCMIGYVNMTDGLRSAAQRGDWATVAKLYNGPAYKRNQYDTKIEAAVARWARTFENPNAAQPKYDDSAERENIKKLGFPTVEAFQTAKGLTADGVIGPITREAIEKALKEQAAKPVNTTAVVVSTTVGTGVGVEVLRQTTETFSQTKDLLTYVKTLGSFGPTVVLVGAIAIVLGVTVFVVLKQLQKAKAV